MQHSATQIILHLSHIHIFKRLNLYQENGRSIIIISRYKSIRATDCLSLFINDISKVTRIIEMIDFLMKLCIVVVEHPAIPYANVCYAR